MRSNGSEPSTNTGFTLTEILIVVAIMGILVTGLMVAINPISQLEKARDSERKSDLKKIQAALELYRADNGHYPYFNHSTKQIGWAKLMNLDINNIDTGLGINYLDKVPIGPGVDSGEECSKSDPDRYHGYVYSGNENKYTIFTNFEYELDQGALGVKPEPAQCPQGGGSGCSSDNISASWSGGDSSCNGTYNYWVNSP